jgi:serine/threonine protein kinase
VADTPSSAAHPRTLQAGNILIDDHGNVKLADYGVATSGFGSFDMNAHQTFVGTPCWCVLSVLHVLLSQRFGRPRASI